MFLAFMSHAFFDQCQDFRRMPFQRGFAQRTRAFSSTGEVVGRAIVEAAQPDNIDGAMPGIHLPELACGDSLFEQRLNPGVEGRHPQLAHVLAASLNALKHEDDRRKGPSVHRGEQVSDQGQQGICDGLVLVDRPIQHLAEWLIGAFKDSFEKRLLAFEAVKDHSFHYMRACRNALSARRGRIDGVVSVDPGRSNTSSMFWTNSTGSISSMSRSEKISTQPAHWDGRSL